MAIKSFKIFFVFCAFAAFLSAGYVVAPCSCSADVVNEVVAIVNDDIITQNEIEVMLIPVYAQLKSVYKPEDMKTPEVFDKLNEAREMILQSLIDNKLVVQEAKKLNIKVEEYEIDEIVDEIRQKFGSQEEFEQAIASQNLTISNLRNKYREQILARKIVSKQIRAKIFVSPSEVAAYYNGHMDEFNLPEEVQVSNILIREDKSKSAMFSEAKGLAERVYGMLQKGYDFAVLAKKYSQGPNAQNGGDMGFVKRGQLMREVDVELFKLKPGELTPIIHTQLGYHIFKVGERKPARIETFQEARQSIEGMLFKAKAETKYQAWLDKLKKDAYIEIKKR